MKTAAVITLAALLAWSPMVRAVGVEGDDKAVSRVGLGVGGGVDQVGGYAQDAYPFAEVYEHAEARLGRWLYVGGAASYRQDINNYNYAIDSWRGHHEPAFALQALVGYDGERFHLSAGPWLYGASRRRSHFRARILPYGVLRMRIGTQAGWHGGLQVGDGAPFTVSGGYSARFMLGTPTRGHHRSSVGLYTSLGEKTLGLIGIDEWRSNMPMAWRFGGALGTMIDHPGHIEVAGFCGVVW